MRSAVTSNQSYVLKSKRQTVAKFSNWNISWLTGFSKKTDSHTKYKENCHYSHKRLFGHVAWSHMLKWICYFWHVCCTCRRKSCIHNKVCMKVRTRYMTHAENKQGQQKWKQHAHTSVSIFVSEFSAIYTLESVIPASRQEPVKAVHIV